MTFSLRQQLCHLGFQLLLKFALENVRGEWSLVTMGLECEADVRPDGCMTGCCQGLTTCSTNLHPVVSAAALLTVRQAARNRRAFEAAFLGARHFSVRGSVEEDRSFGRGLYYPQKTNHAKNQTR